MRYGIYMPTFGECDVEKLVDLARISERAGWDGFFIWDHVTWTPDKSHELVDTTVTLTAIALATNRIRFGALVTPLARRRPWKYAKEMATLDRISGGRVVAGVGLGEPADVLPFGEADPPKVTASRLDEALEVVTALWTGQPTSFSGEHFDLQDAVLAPSPRQVPRMPIWVAGLWPNRAPFRRAARWDGALPMARGHMMHDLTPDELRDCRDYVQRHRDAGSEYDLVFISVTQTRTAERVIEYERAGATWWLEAFHPFNHSLPEFQGRIEAGPTPWA